jgi:hypothetical protein
MGEVMNDPTSSPLEVEEGEYAGRSTKRRQLRNTKTSPRGKRNSEVEDEDEDEEEDGETNLDATLNDEADQSNSDLDEMEKGTLKGRSRRKKLTNSLSASGQLKKSLVSSANVVPSISGEFQSQSRLNPHFSELPPDSNGSAAAASSSIANVEGNGFLPPSPPPPPSSQKPREALIFIHGYNSSQALAVKKFAQLLAAGQYPGYIVPILFAWPSAKAITYFPAQAFATSPETTEQLRQLLVEVQEQGIHAVHIITHSMGARVFLTAMHNPRVQELFTRPISKRKSRMNPEGGSVSHRPSAVSGGNPSSPSTTSPTPTSTSSNANSSPPLMLKRVILTNPDYSLKRFRDSTYYILNSICPHITIYVDRVSHTKPLFC